MSWHSPFANGPQARALQPVLRTALAVAAVLVLVGGFSMRSAIVDAGMHRDLELEDAERAGA